MLRPFLYVIIKLVSTRISREVYIMLEENSKQNEIYEFLKTYTETKGYPPSVREICAAVSLKSTSTTPTV